MQSSTLVVFRTFVMLACLVAVPAVAILGGVSWQDIIHTLERLGPAPQAERQLAAPPAIGIGPAAVNVGVKIPSSAPAFLQTSTIPPPTAAAIEPTSPAGIPAILPSTAETPALLPTAPFWPGQTASLAERLAGNAQPGSAANAPANLAEAGGEQRVVAASFETPAEESAAKGSKFASAPPMRSPGQQSEWIQQQLQSLGALHYRLLAWGPDGKQFKFECKMSLDSNPRYVRFFQSVGDTQQGAMQGVLDQVAAWHRSIHRE